MMSAMGGAGGSFETFVSSVGETVRRALVAFYGVEVGSEAAADAMVVAWERWPTLEAMDNAAGFLFRVGQSKARPHARWATRTMSFPAADRRLVADDDPRLMDLFSALRKLRPEERTAVLMVKSYGFSYHEVADVLNTTESAVTNYVHRGLGRLRSLLEVE